MADRPYLLQLREQHYGKKGPWTTWSTYREPTRATQRREQLIANGHDARVVNTDTGEVLRRACSVCGTTSHDDGMCLI